jgi:hypothetical protein
LRISGSTISALCWTAQNRRARAALADIADHPVFQFVVTSESCHLRKSPTTAGKDVAVGPTPASLSSRPNPTGKKLVWEIEQIFRLAASNGGVLTERGADIILIDDPLKPEEALSDVFRRLKSTGRAGSPSPGPGAEPFMQIPARPYEDQP